MKNLITLLFTLSFGFLYGQNGNLFVELMGSSGSGISVNIEKSIDHGRKTRLNLRAGLGGTYMSSPHDFVKDRIGITPIVGLGMDFGSKSSYFDLNLNASTIVDLFNTHKATITPIINLSAGYKYESHSGFIFGIYASPLIIMKKTGRFPLKPWVGIRIGKTIG